jgi:hypothetical protein
VRLRRLCSTHSVLGLRDCMVYGRYSDVAGGLRVKRDSLVVGEM